MKSFKVAMLAAAATIAMGGAAFAEEADPFAVSFNVGAATDYIFRGITNTNNNPQMYGGADATIMGIGYAGVWVSNVDFGNSTDFEYDLYAGVKPTLGPVAFDLGVIYYGYNNKPSGPDEAYVEWKAAASVPVGPASIGAAVYYSDDFFGETGKATYYEVNGSMPIADTKFSVSGALGHQDVVGPLDYTTWNLGVGYALTDHVTFDLRYWDTDADEDTFGKLYQAQVVGGVKVSF